MTPEEKTLGPWDTSSGMVDDIDGYLSNCRFGINEKYAAKINEAVEDSSSGDQLCFLADIINPENEVLTSLVYSIGKDWRTEDEGKTIVHDTRKNVVKNSRYGIFLDKVVKTLLVDMSQYGEDALHAASWEGLGFHWKTEKLATMKKDDFKDVLMPNAFLGPMNATTEPATAQPVVAQPAAAPVVATPAPRVATPAPRVAAPAKPAVIAKPAAKPVAAKAAVVIDPTLELKLSTLAKGSDLGTFQETALKMKDVASNQNLMASVLNEGADGYWATHQA